MSDEGDSNSVLRVILTVLVFLVVLGLVRFLFGTFLAVAKAAVILVVAWLVTRWVVRRLAG